MLQNNYQYQGAFSEMDEDIGWNDFELRNYDPQTGKWVQQDPYQQFASPYIGMGNDPVNLIDPSGGIGIPCPGTSAIAIAFMKAGEWLANGISTISSVSSWIGMASTTIRVAGVDVYNNRVQLKILNTQLSGNVTMGVGGDNGPDNEYRVYKKDGEVVGYEQTGTKGGDIIDEITYVNLDRIPNADGIEKESVWVKKSYGYSLEPSGIIRSPGSLHINTQMLQSGSVNPIDLTDFIPTKAGLKFAGAVFLAGLKKGATNALKFGGDEAVIHFGRHADQIMKVTGKSAYNLKNYVDDANWIVKNGTFSSKLNGYYHYMGNTAKG